MRIGIYSGSFNPIHTGHAMVANYVAQWGGVDEVWLMVSRLNPLKSGEQPEADRFRMEMAEIIASECTNVKASDFEFSLPQPSYTYVTLSKLRESYPRHEFVLIIGSDNWYALGEWRDADKIIREFGIIVYPRPGYEMPESVPEEVTVLRDAPIALISSTFVRKTISDGGNINYFVPCDVADYIRTNNLYKIEGNVGK